MFLSVSHLILNIKWGFKDNIPLYLRERFKGKGNDWNKCAMDNISSLSTLALINKCSNFPQEFLYIWLHNVDESPHFLILKKYCIFTYHLKIEFFSLVVLVASLVVLMFDIAKERGN